MATDIAVALVLVHGVGGKYNVDTSKVNNPYAAC